MKKKVVLGFGIVLVFLILLFLSSASGLIVDGKKSDCIRGEGKINVYSLSITNNKEKAVSLLIKSTTELYSHQRINFVTEENWKERVKGYEWEEVSWIDSEKVIVEVEPHTRKKVNFTIVTDKNITRGTFYAQFETKDITEKKGTVIIRPIYVTQYVGQIEKPVAATVFMNMIIVLGLMGMGIVSVILWIRKLSKWKKEKRG